MLFPLVLLSMTGHVFISGASPTAFVKRDETPLALSSPGMASFPLSEPLFSVPLGPPNQAIQGGYQQSTERLTEDIKRNWDVLYSSETHDGTYFDVVMMDSFISNPNFIPHPYLPDSWIVVSQRNGLRYNIRDFREMICISQFSNGMMSCTTYPTEMGVQTLPPGPKCQGELQGLTFSNGPHDARVFHGPQHPYTIYNAQATHACFSLWIQDLSSIVGPVNSELTESPEFIKEVELQRPGKYGYMEKNWFVFWDKYNQIYAHYDIHPYRVFARISTDGSAGPDLALAAAVNDHKCMAKWMPKLSSEEDTIHQATNSLSIQFCKRSDLVCQERAPTYIFHIFHWKTFNLPKFVGHYEPHVMVFKQDAPFELYGISQKPFWFYGRLLPNDKNLKNSKKLHEMLYVVSMSWKSRNQKYHGFLDDELLIGFGIEDEKAAGMSIVAVDLFRNLGLCSDA